MLNVRNDHIIESERQFAFLSFQFSSFDVLHSPALLILRSVRHREWSTSAMVGYLRHIYLLLKLQNFGK